MYPIIKKIVVFNGKCILMESVFKSHYKTTVFDNYKADIYWNKIRFFSVQYLNQL